MATVVTISYHCEWSFVTDETYQGWINDGRYNELADAICDAEDDIITAAVYVYNTEFTFLGGDEEQIRLSVYWDKQDKVYSVLYDDFDDNLEYLCDVWVTVRSAHVRF